MLNRFYVHNFRCLENFELALGDRSSVLLLGRNGSGKTTVGRAFEVLQRIARGKSRVSELVTPADITQGRVGIPVRFELEAVVSDRHFADIIAFELPAKFRELRVGAVG